MQYIAFLAAMVLALLPRMRESQISADSLVAGDLIRSGFGGPSSDLLTAQRTLRSHTPPYGTRTTWNTKDGRSNGVALGARVEIECWATVA